jgi:hypothetical protein
MDFNILFNALNGNMVQYLTGSYWMLALFWIIGIFAIVIMLDIGMKYALAFTLPVGIFMIGTDWFDSTVFGQYWNLAIVIIGFLLGLAILKWGGDW